MASLALAYIILGHTLSGSLQLVLTTVIISTVVAQFVDKIGRRPLWLTSTAGMLGSYIVITALSATFANTGQQAAGTAVIPFLFIFFGFYVIAWTIQVGLDFFAQTLY